MKGGLRLGGFFTIWCYGPDGKLKWKDTSHNIVVNAGLEHLLDVVFTGATVVNPWYVGLIDDGTSTGLVAGDTLSSHVGWTENANYTGDRKEFTESRTNQNISNSASKASFAIDTNTQVISGAFLCSVATTTTGTLLCEVLFTGGDKSADSGDTLEVQYDFSAADDGA